MESGRLYWITGLAGGGKSTLAQLLYNNLKPQCPNLVLLDGDCLRTMLRIKPIYTYPNRMDASLQYSNVCYLLTKQNINVVCATVSMFDEVRNWNKQHIPNYTEIFLDVPLSVIKQRDKREIYAQGNDVVGVNVDAEFPINPDVHLQPNLNDSPEHILKKLLLKL